MAEKRSERMIRFGEMHLQARIKANKSREFMAYELNISQKTVHNWETGTTSPTFFQSLEWFRALNINPFPIYLSYLYPSTLPYKERFDDCEIDAAFDSLVQNLSKKDKRALLFLFYGSHGSDPRSVLHMALMHLHSSMETRIVNAESTIAAWEVDQLLNKTVCDKNIQPNTEKVRTSIENAKASLLIHESRYVNL